MTPGKSNIYEIFNGTRVFEIPFYQRSYVWEEKQWERLLTDMYAVSNRAKNYFLGAIILITQKEPSLLCIQFAPILSRTIRAEI